MKTDIDTCPCGKAFAKYECVDEDEWMLTIQNAKVIRGETGQGLCKCNICGEVFSDFDRCMVVEIHKTIKL